MPKKKAKMLEIRQVKSGLGRPVKHRATLRALGLRHHQQTVIQGDTPGIRGMIDQVAHLIEVRELDGEE
ncbi:MAG: 50S ribosomal protein L30 [Gemmatimonadota bacterium]